MKTATKKRPAKSKANAVDITKFLVPFCGLDITARFKDIQSPFVQDGRKYFTDGAAIVAIACECGDTAGTFPPKLHRLIKIPENPKWKPWPAAKYVDGDINCPDCKDGFVKCQKCKHHTIECQRCGGSGDVTAKVKLKIGGTTIHKKYDEKIRSLPGIVKWMVSPEDKYRILFRFDGGVGAVMAFTKE